MEPISLVRPFSQRTQIVDVWVPGRPVSQGSKTMYNANGRSWMAESNAGALTKWRTWVNRVVMQDYAARLKDVSVPSLQPDVKSRLGFHLHGDFVFNSPAKRPSWWPLFLSAPDLDKCLRAVGDALTTLPKKKQVGLWDDDAAVCGISGTKSYGESAGCQVKVWIVRP